jgi:hypothetical protein
MSSHSLDISKIKLLPKFISEIILLHQKVKVLLTITCSATTYIKKSFEYDSEILIVTAKTATKV